jgi:hypothetical protein
MRNNGVFIYLFNFLLLLQKIYHFFLSISFCFQNKEKEINFLEFFYTSSRVIEFCRILKIKIN